MGLDTIKDIEINEYFGLNTKMSKAKIPLGFSSDLKNIDLSTPGIAKVRGGNDTINDGVFVFGAGAGEFDGTDDYITAPDHADWDLAAADFTIEARVRLDGISAEQVIAAQWDEGTTQRAWAFYIDASNNICFEYSTNGTNETKLSVSWSPTASTWYALAVVRNGNNLHFFVDGVQQGATQDVTGVTINNSTEVLSLGAYEPTTAAASFLDGHIDELRISDTARYTSAYTIATTVFSSDANTALLLHFEGDDKSTTFTDSGNTTHTMTSVGGARLHVGAMDAAIKSLYDYFIPSSDLHYILGNFSTKVFIMTEDGRWSVLGTGLTSGEVMDFETFGDICYMGNGVEECKATDDGTNFRKMGITAPTFTTSVATGSAGALTGDYQYRVTYYNSTTGHESSANAISATVSPSGQRVDLSGLTASADPQVDKKRIYRTTAGGAVFLYVGEITNATTTYEDNTADSSLGTTEAPTENDPPPLFVGMVEFDGRIFGFVKDSTEVDFSNNEFLTPSGAGVPQESFSTLNKLLMNAKVFGIARSPNFNELWIHTSKGVFAAVPSGIPEDPYNIRIRNTSWHTISHKSIVNVYNDQWFIAEGGKCMSMDSAGGMSYESYFIEPTLGAGNKKQYKNAQAAHYRLGTKNQYRMIYPSSGQTNPDNMLAANYLSRTPADENMSNYPVWEYHDIAATAIGTVINSDDDELLYIGTTDGKVKKLDTTATNDDDVAIDWSFSVGWMRSAVTPLRHHFPRWALMFFNPLGDYNFSMQTDFDFGSAGGQVYSVKAAPIGDQLDSSFTLDESQLAGASPLKDVTIDLGGEYRYVEITFAGMVKDEIMELHNMVLLTKAIEGVRR